MAHQSQSLGQFIRQRRQQLGLTQEKLAERVGDKVTQAEISRLERGKVALPRRPRMQQLAVALEVPLGVLLARLGWTGSGDIQAAASERTISTAELQSSIDELQADNDHLRASLLDLLRENAALVGLTADPELPDLEEATRRRLGSMLSSGDTAAVVVDTQGAVILRNDAYVTMFAGEPTMIDSSSVQVPHDATPLQRAARRERFSMVFGLTQFGTTTWYWAEGKPMADNEGLPLAVVTIRRILAPR